MKLTDSPNAIKLIAAMAIFILGIKENSAQINGLTYHDGPINLQLRVRHIRVNCNATDDSLIINGQTGFSPDDYTFKVWAKDNANISGMNWGGGACLSSNFNPPGLSSDFNYMMWNYVYPDSQVPMYFDIKFEGWEDDCGSDLPCSGSRCSYQDSCCCVMDSTGCVQFEQDDNYCYSDTFISNLDYRLGTPGQWHNHGFIVGNGCSNNCYAIEIETNWEYLGCPPLSMTFTVSVTTPDLVSGAIRVFVTGGTPPYQYSLDSLSFQTSNIFTSLGLGTYQVYVKDNNGCIGHESFTIDEADCRCNH